MEHYMAEFGQGFVQASVLTENNAIKFKISAAGSCTQSTVRPYITYQNNKLAVTFNPGMNVIVFDNATKTILETKNYLFTQDSSAVNQAFMTYMDSLTGSKLVILASEGKLRTCQELVDWFKSKNSTAWPEKWATQKFDVAYTGFYSTSLKGFSAEHKLCNDGKTKEAINPHLDVVWDYYTDIGATGTPFRISEIATDIISPGGSETQELIRLPDDELMVPISRYNLKAGDMMYLKFQLMIGLGIGTNEFPNGTTRCSIRWFNADSIVSTTNIDAIATPGYYDVWQSFERYLEIPSGVDSFTVYFYKTDISKQDYSAVRNIVLVEASREETPLFRSAEFGVNGIRMNTMIDGTVNELLILNDSKTDDRGRVRGAEFRELQ